MRTFIIKTIPCEQTESCANDTMPGGFLGKQMAWDYRKGKFVERDESIAAGRAYRGMSGFYRAKRIAAKLGAETSIGNQW